MQPGGLKRQHSDHAHSCVVPHVEPIPPLSMNSSATPAHMHHAAKRHHSWVVCEDTGMEAPSNSTSTSLVSDVRSTMCSSWAADVVGPCDQQCGMSPAMPAGPGAAYLDNYSSWTDAAADAVAGVQGQLLGQSNTSSSVGMLGTAGSGVSTPQLQQHWQQQQQHWQQQQQHQQQQQQGHHPLCSGVMGPRCASGLQRSHSVPSLDGWGPAGSWLSACTSSHPTAVLSHQNHWLA